MLKSVIAIWMSSGPSPIVLPCRSWASACHTIVEPLNDSTPSLHPGSRSSNVSYPESALTMMMSFALLYLPIVTVSTPASASSTGVS